MEVDVDEKEEGEGESRGKRRGEGEREGNRREGEEGWVIGGGKQKLCLRCLQIQRGI